MGQIRTMKNSQGQTLWVYDTGGGETLVSIANSYLIPAVDAETVATYNGLDAFQASPVFSFPAGESIAVPIEWVLPASPRSGLTVPISGAGSATRSVQSGLTDTQLLLIAGALVLAVAAVK